MRRRGRDVEIPRRRIAAPPRLRRGYSVETATRLVETGARLRYKRIAATARVRLELLRAGLPTDADRAAAMAAIVERCSPACPCCYGEMDDDCAICLTPLAPRDEEAGETGGAVVLPCGHVFHGACLVPWLAHAVAKKRPLSCPLCRAVLLEAPLE